MKSFNLLPWREIKREHRLINLVYVFGVLTIVLSMFMIMTSVIIINKIHARKITLQEMNIKLKNQEKLITNINAMNNEVDTKSQLLTQFENNKTHRIKILVALEKISLVAIGKIIFQEIHCADNNIKLNGKIKSKRSLNNIINKLKASEVFSDVKIDKLLEENEDVKIWISLSLKK